MPVPETDTGGVVENTEGREITLSKELGKNGPVTSGEGVPARAGRSEEAQATVYQKHRSPLSRKTMYGG